MEATDYPDFAVQYASKGTVRGSKKNRSVQEPTPLPVALTASTAEPPTRKDIVNKAPNMQSSRTPHISNEVNIVYSTSYRYLDNDLKHNIIIVSFSNLLRMKEIAILEVTILRKMNFH